MTILRGVVKQHLAPSLNHVASHLITGMTWPGTMRDADLSRKMVGVAERLEEPENRRRPKVVKPT